MFTTSNMKGRAAVFATLLALLHTSTALSCTATINSGPGFAATVQGYIDGALAGCTGGITLDNTDNVNNLVIVSTAASGSSELDCEAVDRAFSVSGTGKSLTLSKIHLTNSTLQGMVYATGTNNALTLHEVTFTHCRNSAVYSSVALTVVDSHFEDNYATLGAGIHIAGGSVSVIGTTFTSNTVSFTGVAIYNPVSATPIHIETCEFTFGYTGGGGGEGGAVYASGTLTVVDSLFANNYANHGGALRTHAGTYVYNCIFESNTVNVGTGHGGSIRSSGSADVIIRDSVFKANSAYVGASLRIDLASHAEVTNTSFTEGYVSYLSSVMWVENSNITVTNSTVENNVATHGAAMYVPVSTSTFTDCVFVGNTALNTANGASVFWLDNCIHTAIVRSTFKDNNSTGTFNMWRSTVEIRDCTFAEEDGRIAGMSETTLLVDNVSVKDSGFEDREGGAFLLGCYTSATFSNIEIHGATALNGGAFVVLLCNNDFDTNMVVQNATITGCSATERGGAIAIDTTNSNDTIAHVDMVNCTIQDNSAGNSGAIDIVNNAEVSIIGGSVSCNYAFNATHADRTGGISLREGAQLTLENVDISSNFVTDAELPDSVTTHDGLAYNIVPSNVYESASTLTGYSAPVPDIVSCLAFCGNSILDAGEGCDDGNWIDGDGCSSNCTFVCGDGWLNGTEECDDGNTVSGDGCEANCTWSCGNGVVDGGAGEECDDGNAVDGDGCEANCTTVCGDGFVVGSEECDDGNTVSGDGCEANCTWSCGNGVVDGGAGEECDDGNAVGGDGCEANCTTVCGDGFVVGSEECDDGNTVSGDGCEANCTRSCGNGVVDSGAGEECDDGNSVDGDGCDNDCAWSCGNSFVDVGEECDDGNAVETDGCYSNCTLSCGDGYVDAAAGEECDDGNTIESDGCLNNCTLPPMTTSAPSTTTTSRSSAVSSNSSSSLTATATTTTTATTMSVTTTTTEPTTTTTTTTTDSREVVETTVAATESEEAELNARRKRNSVIVASTVSSIVIIALILGFLLLIVRRNNQVEPEGTGGGVTFVLNVQAEDAGAVLSAATLAATAAAGGNETELTAVDGADSDECAGGAGGSNASSTSRQEAKLLSADVESETSS